MDDSPPPIEVVDGKYRVESRIGVGTFSDVFVVTSPSGRAALKLLRKGLGGEAHAEAVADFKHEFSILKNLNHPNIARILDFGYDRTLRQYYYTSELVSGRDLFEATAGQSIDFILELFVQTLRAFHYLHAYRVYHFDVKAANILVAGTRASEEASVKVIDFGLASLDPKGKMIGTPSYMAPEIIAKERPDGRADLYSLGVLFYSCLTRTNPFRGRGVAETLKNQQTLIAPPVSQMRTDLPLFLEKILARLLEKNPANRYQRADEVLREINLSSPKKFALETRETLLSYLPDEGRLIGRRKEGEVFARHVRQIFSPASPETFGLILVAGEKGTGKSRLLKEYKYAAQLQMFPVLSVAVGDPGLTNWVASFHRHLSAGRPTVFLIDDLDRWEEEKESYRQFRATLLRLLFTEGEERTPLILVGTCTSPEVLPRSLREAKPPWSLVPIGPFTGEELREYVVSLTGLEEPPPELLSGLLSRSDGNPLLVTELLRSLIQEGALFDATGRWKETTFEDIGVDFSKARFGGVLEEILLKRFERLGPPERKVLEALSVASRPLRFHEISGLVEDAEATDALEGLLFKGTLLRDEGRRDYRIKNALLADLIGQRLPEERRKKLHDRAARFFPEGSEERLFHEIRGSDLARAFALCREGGERFLQEARGREAADLFRFALKIPLSHPPEEVAEFSLKLGEAYLIALDYPSALTALGEAERILSELKGRTENVHREVDLLLRVGAVYLKMGEREKARMNLSEALGLLRYLKGDRVRELVAENLRGAILLQEGKTAEARELFERTWKVWDRELSAEAKRRVTNNDLGVVYLSSEEYPQALRQFTADLDFFKALGDRLLLARTYYHLGQATLGLKELSQAAAHYQEAVRYAQPLKNTELLLRAYNGLGNVFNLMGRPEEAVRHYEHGLDLSERTGDLRSYAAILVNIGIIRASQGEREAARRSLEMAISFLKSLPERLAIDWQVLARALLEEGDMARKEKRWGDSERFLREALQVAEGEEGARSLRFWVLHALGELFLEKGEGTELDRLLPQMKQAARTPDEREQALETYDRSRRSLEKKVTEMSGRLDQYQSLARISQRGLETQYNYDAIIGRSKPILEILRLLDKITDTDLAVFIHGESGTGKELIARALHFNSSRSGKRFVAVNCGAIPATLMESELFGYKAGAFTGATRDKKGLFEEADGGTLFLDEVAELDSALQPKLLRVVQDGEFYRLGDQRSIKTDTRLVSASNKEIQRLVAEKKFREDLYYRLCQIRIDLPPLRERREDIPLLVSHFIQEEAGRKMKVSSRLLKALVEYDWPGNIRELENLVKVAVALSEGDVIDARAIPSNYGITRYLRGTVSGGIPSSSCGTRGHPIASSLWSRASRRSSAMFQGALKQSSELSEIPPETGTLPPVPIDASNLYDPQKGWYDYEKLIIAKAYQANRFRAKETAQMLGIAPATLYKKIREIGLAEKDHPLYRDPFQYEPEKRLKDYLRPVFQAALRHAGNKPYTAIAQLKVSQGYYYKVMKER